MAFKMPNTIQLREHSKGSGTDGATHKIWAVNANWNGVNRYWNGVNRYWNVEANSVRNPNEWNSGNRVLSRNFLHFTALYYTGLVFYSSSHQAFFQHHLVFLIEQYTFCCPKFLFPKQLAKEI